MISVSQIIARVYSWLVCKDEEDPIDLRWGPHIYVGNADMRVGTYKTGNGDYMAVVYDYRANMITDKEGPFIFRDTAYDIATNTLMEMLPDDGDLPDPDADSFYETIMRRPSYPTTDEQLGFCYERMAQIQD